MYYEFQITYIKLWLLRCTFQYPELLQFQRDTYLAKIREQNPLLASNRRSL